MQSPRSSVRAHTIASTWPYHWCNHLALALVHWSLHPADGFLLLTQCTLSGMKYYTSRRIRTKLVLSIEHAQVDFSQEYCSNGYNGVVHESSFPNTYNGTKHRASTIWLLNKNSTILVVKLHLCSSVRKYVAPLQALMQPPSSGASAHTIASTWP